MNIAQSIKFMFQRWRRGFSDDELWDLDQTIAKFSLPRIKEFRKQGIGRPGDLLTQEWDYILGEIEWFLEVHADKNMSWVWSPEAFTERGKKRYKRAGKYFGKYFGNLWI